MPTSAPFSFPSFDTPPQSSGATNNASTPSFTQAELDAAFAAGHAEGVEAGRNAALDSLVAAETAALEKLAAALEGDRSTLRDGISVEVKHLRKTANAVVTHICGTLVEAHELETATHLVDRLVAVSDDRAPATIGVGKHASKAFHTKLTAMLNQKKLADFIVVETDEALRAGDVSLSWRGGAVRQTHKEIRAAIDAAFAETFSDKEHSK